MSKLASKCIGVHEYCGTQKQEDIIMEKGLGKRVITEELILQFGNELYRNEKTVNTITKYMRDIRKFQEYLHGRIVTKELAVEYKEYLRNCGKYKISSINTFLVVLNRFCESMGWYDVKVKHIKIQNEAFCPEERCMTRQDYIKLVQRARAVGNMRLTMIILTLACTGARISELAHFQVDTLKSGVVRIYNKGKSRIILMPDDLRRELLAYVRQNKIQEGPLFRTKNGKPVNRSNIWREMKTLGERTGVDRDKVFPHNFRHLFARVFYGLKKDIATLADILGHSNISTTRNYLKSTGEEHRKELNRMKMAVA